MNHLTLETTDEAHFTTLDNGLVLIVREDHSSPVVSAQAWCRTGSIHEGKWLGAGLSHVLEHMLFKGTQRRAPGRIDQEVQDAGGYMNAYTSFDRTVYWINTPKSGTAIALDVLADIMQNATIPEEELKKELDVIRREMDMGQDDPGRRSSRRLFETAYAVSPYRQSIIGHPQIFNRLTRQDVLDYYQARYAPNNCFFVVVGDVEASEVIDQIGAHYREGSARPVAPLYLPKEPAQMAPRRLIEEASIELGHAHAAWHIPDIRDPDIPAMDVLATILGTGRSSRLYQELREKKAVVHSTDAWTYSPGSSGLFGVSAVIDGTRLEDLMREVETEISRVQEALVTETELNRARNMFVAGFLSSRKTMQGQAQDLGGNWLSAGDLSFSKRYLDEIQRLTPKAIQNAAVRHLKTNNQTTYALLPKGSSKGALRRAEATITNPVRLQTLANGLRVVLKRDERLPFVEVRLAFGGGVIAETQRTNGISSFMARLLSKGTRTRSAVDIAETIEGTGGSLEAYSGNNSFGFTLEVLRHEFAKGMDVLSDVVLESNFPEEAFRREVEVHLASIEAQKDQLLQGSIKTMRRIMFGEEGYGLDPLGSRTTITALNRGMVEDHYRKLAVAENGVMAVFGNFEEATILHELERGLGAMPRGSKRCSPSSNGGASAPLRGEVIRDKKQAVVVVGFPGCSMSDPRRYAMDLIQEACSDLGSRVFVRIRERLGLAYYLGAQNFSGVGTGFFTFYAGTNPESAKQVEEELMLEAATLVAEGMSDQELARAKAKIIGHREIAHQDLGALAQTVALDELLGNGYDSYLTEASRYQEVTLEHIRESAQALLDPNRVVIVTTHPGKGHESKLKMDAGTE